jgi:hypothetical protein
MKFKVGDKVKFLNEKGGGVVSRIIDPKMVNVTIEDGFEIPVLMTELLRIETEAPFDSPKHMFREDFDTEIRATTEPDFIPESLSIPLTVNGARGTVPEGLFLAFVPRDQKWLIMGMVDIYLINHTTSEILYSIFLEKENGGFKGFDYGSCLPESMILLESIERDHLPKWSKGIVQAIFHPEDTEVVYYPGNSGFKLKLPRFYLENSYQDSAIMVDKCILISLIPLSTVGIISGSETSLKETLEVPVHEAKEQKPVNIIDRHKTSPTEAVVDLHIEELTDHAQIMESSEILNTQVNYFTRCLENGMHNNLTKIIFIHGVGTGVLKTAMKEILKEYTNVEFRDASMRDFGYGAMEVIIRKII